MNDQGQLRLLCCTDMSSKTISLPIHIVNGTAAFALLHLVIVESSFTNRNDPWQLGFDKQVLNAGLIDVFIVWVNTHGAPEIVI